MYQKYVLGTADALQIIGPESIYDEEYYARRKQGPLRSDAWSVGMAIYSYFNPESVIDFGCAIGAHLEPFHKNNVLIKGIEGNKKAFNHAVVPSKYLEQHDLREPYTPTREYDIAMCFEVAEHIPTRFSETLVKTLAKSSSKVIMTAATPGQTGTHHVNEQPREFWYDKFESVGMKYDAEAVEELREILDLEKATWIPENLTVFTKNNKKYGQ
jgi:hypothetical protein